MGNGVIYIRQFLFPSSSAFPVTKDDTPALGEILQSGRHEPLTEEKHHRLGHLVASALILLDFNCFFWKSDSLEKKNPLSKVFQSAWGRLPDLFAFYADTFSVIIGHIHWLLWRFCMFIRD